MKEQSSLLPLTCQKLAKDQDLNKICRVQAPSATHQASRSLGLNLLYGPHREKSGFDVAPCILWSGVFEWSCGVEYWSGVESDFGV